MKSSIHLFYGIIIGVLICACTGSLKEDMAEFKEEKLKYLGDGIGEANLNIPDLKKEGWTIIDVEVFVRPDGERFFAHVGK